MVTTIAYGLSVPGLSPGRGHCFVYLGKTLYSHSASIDVGVYLGTACDGLASFPGGSSLFLLQKPE